MTTPGNVNALKSGNRTDRAGIALAQLGKRYAGIYHALKILRRAVEKHVAGPLGTVDLGMGAKINEAVRWEMVARVTQKLIADHPEMPPGETISALNTVANATRQRNAMLGKLLDGKVTGDDPWAVIDSEPYETIPRREHAPDNAQGDVGGDSQWS